MALLDTLLVRLGIDADDLLNGTDQAANRFESRLRGMAAGAAGVAVGAAFAVGVASAMDISAAQTKLTNQLGLSSAEAARVGGIAGDVFAAGFGGSLDEVSEAVGGIGTSIGDLGSFTKGQISQMTKSALGLAKTFGVDVNDATNAVGQMMKTGLVKNATEGFDLVTKTMQKVPASLRDDLLPTVQEYSTQFRNLGLSGKDAMALMVQGVNAGARDIDVVADTLKEFSIEAVQGSEKISSGWKKLGLDSGKMSSMMEKGGSSAKKALDMTLDSLREVEDPTKRNAIAVELFGTKAEDMGKALFALDPSSAAAKTGLDGVGGAAKKMTDNMEASPAQQLDAALRTVQQSLGQAFLPLLAQAAPMLVSFAQKIAEVVNKISAFAAANPGITKVAVAIAGLVAAGMALTMMFGQTARLMMSSVTALRSFGGAIGGAGGRMRALGSSIASLASRAGTLAAAFLRASARVVAAAARMAASFIASAARMTASMVATAARVVAAWAMMAARALMAAARMAASWLIAMGPVGIIIAIVIALVALIIANWDKIKTWTAAAWNWVWEKIKMIFNFLKNLFLNFTGPGLIIKHWDTIKTATAAAWNWVWNKVKAVFNFLKNLFMNFTGPGLIIKHWNKIKSATVAAWNAVKNFVGNALSAIKNFIVSRVNAAKSLALAAFNAIRSGISNAINRARSAVLSAVGQIVGAIRGIKSKVVGALRSAGSWLYNAGKNVIRGLINGIKNMASGAVNAAKGVVKGAVNGAKSLLGISSPSKVFMEIGEFTTEGLSKGLMADMQQIDKAADRLMRPLDNSADATRQQIVRTQNAVRNPNMATPGYRSGMTDRGKIQVDVTGTDENMKELMRKIFRVDGNLEVR